MRCWLAVSKIYIPLWVTSTGSHRRRNSCSLRNFSRSYRRVAQPCRSYTVMTCSTENPLHIKAQYIRITSLEETSCEGRRRLICWLRWKKLVDSEFHRCRRRSLKKRWSCIDILRATCVVFGVRRWATTIILAWMRLAVFIACHFRMLAIVALSGQSVTNAINGAMW